ncbi:MAG: alpha/beta hydrolase [bacterium]|nr:alpha/beta hydrolase [bacterium]
MVSQLSTLPWVRGYFRRSHGSVPNTYTADYSLVDLIRKGLIPAEDGQKMLHDCGLEDFAWQVTWPEDFETPDELLDVVFQNAQGYVIFVHGWTGNHLIWEELPGLCVTANRRLVSISIDHNGFGQSVFSDVTPHLYTCNPPAAMQTLQRWVDLLKIRRQPGIPTPRVINFVGHSMGGATLFYMNPIHWRVGEVTRTALAPALLLEAEINRAFFTTLGFGIGILQRIPILEIVERFVKPTMVNVLCSGASNNVKNIHTRQYDETPRGITGATFLAMGQLDNFEIARTWDLFRVMLGHRDRLVGLTEMLDLLSKMEFPSGNVRVVPGSHYMFSVGTENPHNAFQHAQNRELVVQDILEQHNQAYNMQRTGQRVG